MSEQKKPEPTPELTIQEAVKQAISEALPIATALAAKALQDNQNKPLAGVAPPTYPRDSSTRCSECGQYLKACKNEHRLACIYPDDEEAASFFPGVKINGVRYLSNGPGHLITVPKNSDVEYTMAAWVRNERDQRIGKKNLRNSGSIGATNNFNAYKGGNFGNR